MRFPAAPRNNVKLYNIEGYEKTDKNLSVFQTVLAWGRDKLSS